MESFFKYKYNSVSIKFLIISYLYFLYIVNFTSFIINTAIFKGIIMVFFAILFTCTCKCNSTFNNKIIELKQTINSLLSLPIAPTSIATKMQILADKSS